MRLGDEAQLIAAVRMSDWNAFETICRAYRPRLVVFARGYCGLTVQGGHEAVQEVFLTLWRCRASWRAPNGIESYLLEAVRSRVPPVEYVRPLHRRPPSSSNDPEEPGSLMGEVRAMVRAIVDAMPTRYRDVYDL